jgi:16S rRNA (cytosine967-C5)-methyltransferase
LILKKHPDIGPESLFGRGYYTIQGLASQLIPYLCKLESGLTIIDAAAGPGGKLTHMCEMTTGNAKIFAVEKSDSQLERARQTAKRLGHDENIEWIHKDFMDYTPSALVDRVLLDAPCTGLGALRRRPEARWRKSSEDLKQLVELQYELLESSYKALKPGGQLLYVTCSPHLSETTAVITKAVKNLGVQVNDLTAVMNENFMGGTLPTNRKTVQLYTHRDGTDCMFMALITK